MRNVPKPVSQEQALERQLAINPDSVEGRELASFTKALDFTMKREGGLFDDTAKSGEYSKYGISKASYPSEDITNLTKERASEIYKQDYWDKVKASEMPPAIAMLAFDMAVNHGTGGAAKLLQRAVGAKADGIIGSKTLAKLNQVYKQNPVSLIDSIVDTRREFYKKLKGYDRFGRGWEARAIASSEAAKDNIQGI
jgi:lysozyme family protein